MNTDGLTLSDFLGTLGNAYGAYANANATTDAAKTNQQTAAIQAATAAQNAAASNNIKTYIVYGIIGVVGLLMVVFLFKKLK